MLLIIGHSFSIRISYFFSNITRTERNMNNSALSRVRVGYQRGSKW